jgi:hypothetical protein
MAKAPTDDLSSFSGHKADWFRIAEFNQQDDWTWLVGPYGRHKWKSDVRIVTRLVLSVVEQSVKEANRFVLSIVEQSVWEQIANINGCLKINFTIPSTTPPGAYLLRLEQFPFDPYLQFYVNCAHIKSVSTSIFVLLYD